MVRTFREDPKAFRNVVERHGTALQMGHFKVREVEVRSRGYTILENVFDPSTIVSCVCWLILQQTGLLTEGTHVSLLQNIAKNT